MHRVRRARPSLVAVAAVVLSVLLSGCSAIEDLTGGDDPVEAESPSAAAEKPYDSQFTRDGTFQSHVDVNGVDFVYNMYPTKATPRTNEWYPRGTKYFSFTFGAYDLDRGLRDPFATKRKVYLSDIRVTSRTVLADGSRGAERPYQLAADAKTITFDPEPVAVPRYGMLITSPKGAFELRNQAIGEMTPDTRGLDLTFVATVWIQERAGVATRYYRRQIKQRVPIAIFPSEDATVAAEIPVNAG